ncbi:MAG: cyclase family protein [Frankiales bacterium]|nr:cyclase family protein [Frankiales bacterium]
MTLVDLTHHFVDGMFGVSTLPPVRVTRLRSLAEDGVSITAMDCAVHSGTHLDAPAHFVPGGESVADLTLDRVSGPAVGLQVRCTPDHEITVDELRRAATDLRPHDIALVCTGWSRYFRADPDVYRHHPYLSTDAAQWLVDRHVKMVAMDVPSPDRPEHLRPVGFDFPVHHVLLGAGVLVAEHLNDLEPVVGRRGRAFAFPLRIDGSDGSPVRFVVEL